MIGSGNVLQYLGLSGRPALGEGSSVGSLALFGAGRIVSHLGGNGCCCSLIVSCVVTADMSCSAGLAILAPLVLNAPIVVDNGNSCIIDCNVVIIGIVFTLDDNIIGTNCIGLYIADIYRHFNGIGCNCVFDADIEVTFDKRTIDANLLVTNNCNSNRSLSNF